MNTKLYPKTISSTKNRLQKALKLSIAAAALSLSLASTASAQNVTISGTVFRSPDGLPLLTGGGAINGTPTGTIANNQPIYVYIINQPRDILARTTVAANGTYSVTLPAGSAAAVQLASTLYQVGTGNKVQFVGLPSDYFSVGEGDNAAGDLNPDYSFPVAPANNITVNFAFEERPSSVNSTIGNYTYTDGRLNIPASAFNGTDPEDGPYTGNLLNRSVDFYPPAPISNTQLYYFDTLLNFTLANSKITIDSFKPNRVSLKITGPAATRSFSYSVVDDAGARSYVPTTISTAAPLSIKLASIDGVWKNEGAVISWSTMGEKMNDYFILERSTDGVNFRNIEKVVSKAPEGNSSSILSYSAADYSLGKDKITEAYYRLRAVDQSGIASISRIVHLTDGSKSPAGSWSAYPNPASDVISIAQSASANGAQVQLLDAKGTVVATKEMHAGENSTFNVAQLPNGLYFLQMTNADGISTSRQISVAH